MKPLKWNLGKNSKLKEERGIGFENVEDALQSGFFRIEDNRSRNYPGQKCFVIRYRTKTWLVPFRENKDSLFLHTIFEVK